MELQVLDRIDKKILYQLDSDARRSTSELARSLKLGRDIVEYRIRRLIERGIINNFVATINPYPLGLTVYKTYFRLESNKARVQRLITALKNHKNTLWLARSDGPWDLMVGIMARSPHEYYSIDSSISSEYADVILVSTTSTLVETHVYKRSYFGEGSAAHYVGIGGHVKSVSLDTLERRVISELATNARATFAELAQRLKVTPDVIKYRIEKLMENGIITGFRIEPNLEQLGMVFLKSLLSLRERSVETELELEEYCKSKRYVTYFIRQLGNYPIELEFEVPSYQVYYEIIDEMREKFPKLIRSVETILLRSEHYRWVLP